MDDEDVIDIEIDRARRKNDMVNGVRSCHKALVVIQGDPDEDDPDDDGTRYFLYNCDFGFESRAVRLALNEWTGLNTIAMRIQDLE